MRRTVLCIVAIASASSLLMACDGAATPDISAVQTQAAHDFAATLTAEAPTSTPTEVATEVPTAGPTATIEIPTPTSTPEPTATPIIATSTPEPSPTPTSQVKITEDMLRMANAENDWQIHLVDVVVKPGEWPERTDRQDVVLIIEVTNMLQWINTFPGLYLVLVDSQGRTYEQDISRSIDYIMMFELDWGADVYPDATAITCISYSVPLDAHSFAVSPFWSVDVWEGRLSFELP